MNTTTRVSTVAHVHPFSQPISSRHMQSCVSHSPAMALMHIVFSRTTRSQVSAQAQPYSHYAPHEPTLPAQDQFQVSMRGSEGSIGRMYIARTRFVSEGGWSDLYRVWGLNVTRVVGDFRFSCAFLLFHFYMIESVRVFCSCIQLKRHANNDAQTGPRTAPRPCNSRPHVSPCL